MKKILLSITLLIAMAISVHAQDIELYWNGEKLPDTVGIYGDGGGDFELVFEAYVKNTSEHKLQIGASRNIIQVVEGTDNSFCWSGSCYSPMTDTSNADYDLILPAGQMSPDPPFSGHYTHGQKSGETIVKYTLFERGNEDNCDSVIVIFKYSLTGVKDNIFDGVSISDAYPNPATNKVNFDFKLAGMNSATVNIINLLGSVVKSADLITGANKVSVDVSDLPQGVYFYSVVVNGNIYQTKKLIIK